MRAAIRSASAPVGALAWPRRTCSATERVSCAQQAAQATQVSAARAVNAIRTPCPHWWPSPWPRGLPTTTTSTVGVAAKTTSAVSSEPVTSAIRLRRVLCEDDYPPWVGPIVKV